jgi:hypothetical protein
VILVEIQAQLEALGTLGTLTRWFMPGSPDAVGTLYEYSGEMPEGRLGVRGVGYEHPSVQIIFRGAPYDGDSPRAKAEIAYHFLADILPGPLGNGITTEYLTVKPVQSPFPIRPVDAQNRHYIGFNIHIMKEPTA